MLNMEKQDLIIIGAGPAGLSAAVYAARYKLNFQIIGKQPGGVMGEAYDVQNYPGVPETTGSELVSKMTEQLEGLGVKLITEDVVSAVKEDGGFKITTNANEYQAKNILLALGAKRNKLGVPGEEELCGKGVSYCATCDGFFFKDKTIAVVGGGDSAAGAAVYLSNLAKKVYLLVRRDELRADPSWQERIAENEKIEVLYKTQVSEIVGTEKVEKLKLNTNKELEVDGIFIEIGETPQSILFDGLNIKRDHQGYVEVHANQRTSINGVWAAGDCTNASNRLRQIITACAEGAVATVDIYTEIKKNR